MLKKLELMSIVFAIILGVLEIILIYGVFKTWKVNKFYSFLFLALAIAAGITFYALFGEKFFG